MINHSAYTEITVALKKMVTVTLDSQNLARSTPIHVYMCSPVSLGKYLLTLIMM